MSINDSRKFVEIMRDDPNYKKRVLETSNPEELHLFLNAEGLKFDKRELIEAMAECMQQLELQVCNV